MPIQDLIEIASGTVTGRDHTFGGNLVLPTTSSRPDSHSKEVRLRRQPATWVWWRWDKPIQRTPLNQRGVDKHGVKHERLDTDVPVLDRGSSREIVRPKPRHQVGRLRGPAKAGFWDRDRKWQRSGWTERSPLVRVQVPSVPLIG